MFGKAIIIGILVVAVTQSYGASLNHEGNLKGVEDATRYLLEKLRTFVSEHEKDYLGRINNTLVRLNNETRTAVTNATKSIKDTLNYQLKEIDNIKQKADPKKAEHCVKGQKEAISRIADLYLKNITVFQKTASENGSVVSYNSTQKIRGYSYVVEDYSEQLNKCGSGITSTICLTTLSAKISAQFGIYPVRSEVVLVANSQEISKIEKSVRSSITYNEVQAEYKGKRIIESVEACINK